MMRVALRSEVGRRQVDSKTGALVVRGAPWLVAVLLLLGATLVNPARVLGDSTGEQNPTAASSGGFTNAASAEACDGGTATATSNNQTEIYSVYGLTLPNSVPTPVITGIQVRVRAGDGTSRNRKLRVSLSWDGGTTYTDSLTGGVLQTRNLGNTLKDYFLGASTYLWGRTGWAPADVTDANFRVKVVAREPGPSGGPSINLDCIPVTVFYEIPGLPSLNVDKTASPDPVGTTGDLTYTITYSNTGESTATNVIVTDFLPANTSFESANPAPTSVSGGTVTWNVGSVPVGGSGVLTLVVKVSASVGVQIVNTYSIAGDQNPASFGSPVSTTVGNAVLTLTKSASPNPVAPGGTLTYTLNVQNVGSVTASNVVVNEGYDVNASFASQSSDCAASFGGPPDNDQWTIASLVGGGTCTITITTTVGSSLGDGVVILNTADTFDNAGDTASASAFSIVEQCAGQADGSPCNDDNACTQTDTCQNQLCAGTPYSCAPPDQCHQPGTCNGDGSCTYPSLDDGTLCNDGDDCSSGDVCTSGVCAGAPYSCDPPDQCHQPGTCNGDGTCTYLDQLDGTLCNDGVACTSGDVCTSGVCGGTPYTCAPPDQCHQDGTCNGDGSCSYAAQPDGTPCNDHNADTCRDICTSGTCGGSTDPVACVDYFKCYAARTAQGTTRFTQHTVTLLDEFESKKTIVARPVQICNPASEANGATLDPTTHLVCYAIRNALTKPLQPRFLGQDLETSNIFKPKGGDKVRASRAQMVCVPAEQFNTETSSGDVDHLKCYAAGVQRGTSRLTQFDVPVADEFESKLTRVARPVSICNPVHEDGSAVTRPTAHLQCYAIRDATTRPLQSRFTKRDVPITDDFGSETLTVTRPTTMCVPSLTTPMP